MGYFFSLSKSAATVGLEVSEWMLLVFGGVLVLGIFGEYKKLPKRLLLLWPATVFEILVMVGVAGELLGDGGVFIFSSHLQSIEDQELSSLGSNAGQLEARLKIVGDKATRAESTAGTASVASSNAVGSASTAVKSASSALIIARGARQEADTFEKGIQSARKDAAGALANLAEAKRLAEEAQLGLERFKAPRAIDQAHFDRLALRLSQFPGQTFRIATFNDDMEAINFKDRIGAILIKAKWSPPQPPLYEWLAVAVVGVVFGFAKDASQRTRDIATSSALILTSEGIAAGAFELQDSAATGWNPATIDVMIGKKPQQ